VLPDCETHVRPTFAFHRNRNDDRVAGKLLQDSPEPLDGWRL
jgi:hypothetical protein